MDITDRLQATADLILRTDDPVQMEMFSALSSVFEGQWLQSDEAMLYQEHETKFVGAWMARKIHSFLFSVDHQYRIGCVFDGHNLFVDEQWEFMVDRTFKAIREGLDTVDLQESWNYWGYTCDICRVELSYFETAYHCECQHKHDFCITCIHSMVQQHQELQTFMTGILNDELNANCIQEIVAFTVGHVLKFI